MTALVAAVAVAAVTASTLSGSLVVEATGVGQLTGTEEAKAADDALVDAQRLAVEQAAGVFLTSETEVRDMQLIRDVIRTHTSGYLASYEVVDRKRGDDGLYRVTIRANVKLAAVAADLLDIDAVAERLNRPRLVVLFEEQDRGQSATGHIAAMEAQKALAAKGFELVDASHLARLQRPELLRGALDGDPAALLQLATDEGIEVAVVGKVETHLQQSPVAGMYCAGASIEAKAFNTQTGQLLASNALQLGATPQRQAATAPDPDAASRAAFAKAATQLMLGDPKTEDTNAFIAQILTAWVRSPTVLRLEVASVSADQRGRLMEALQGLRFVKEVVTRKYEDETLAVDIRAEAPLRVLVEEVDGLAAGEARLAITGLKANTAQAELR